MRTEHKDHDVQVSPVGDVELTGHPRELSVSSLKTCSESQFSLKTRKMMKSDKFYFTVSIEALRCHVFVGSTGAQAG